MNSIKWLVGISSIGLLLMGSAQTYAQSADKYFTKEGHVSFFSEAPLEKIEAENYKVTSILDLASGAMEFAILIKAFEFEKALMQEHFNENYMESSKFPKAIFKGKIQNLSDVDFATPGTYEVKVAGDLEIHGVKNPVETDGTLEVTTDGIKAQSKFIVLVKDYEIEIPAVVAENIAKQIEVAVDVDLKPFQR